MQTKNRKLQALTLTIFATLLIPTQIFAFARKRSPIPITRNSCLSGTQDQIADQAQRVLYSVTNLSNPSPSATIESLFPGAQHSSFTYKLHQAMETLNCAFDDKAQFDTIAETVDSIENHSFQISPSTAPKFLKPGFKAIVGGVDSDNTLFIETTTDGFVFHACEPDPQTGPGVDLQPMPPSPACPTMLNSSVFIPVEKMLQTTNGIKAAVLTVMRVIGSMSIIITSNMGWNIVSPLAQGAAQMVAPDPIGTYERDHSVDNETSDMLAMGNIEEKNHEAAGTPDDNMIVTRLLPYKYEDLKQALTDIISQTFSQEYKDLQQWASHPNDPNLEALPALQMERDFHTRMVNAYKQATQPSPWSTPTPAASAP